MKCYEVITDAHQFSFTEQFFITREMGEIAYPYFKSHLESVAEGDGLVLAFPPNQLIDGSFADETIIRLGEEIISGAFGERGLFLVGLSENSMKNISAVIALKRLKLVFLASESTGIWKCVGHLEPNLAEALQILGERGRLTAPELADYLKLAINTASNRLKRLYDQRLVRREYEISPKGLQYIYHFWQWRQ